MENHLTIIALLLIFTLARSTCFAQDNTKLNLSARVPAECPNPESGRGGIFCPLVVD